jgi:hypothetical protein
MLPDPFHALPHPRLIPASDLILLPAGFNLPAPQTAIRKIHLAFGEDGAELRAEC